MHVLVPLIEDPKVFAIDTVYQSQSIHLPSSVQTIPAQN